MASASGVFSGRSQYSLVQTVNQWSQDIGGNSSTLQIDLRINESPNNGSYSLTKQLTWSWSVDGQTGSGGTTYDFRNYDVLVLYSASPAIGVGHNADGTKSLGFSAGAGGGTTIGGASCGGSMSLSTIPRASTPTADGDNVFQAGDTITINTNWASSSFTHTLEYYFGSASGTIATGVGGSTTWAVPLSLLSQIPNSTSGTGTLRCHTYSGGTFIGTRDVGITIVAPSTIVPDFTTVTHAEATTGVAANVGAYVQGITTLAVALTGAAGVYGSTISSRKIEVLTAGGTVLQTVNAASGTTGIIDGSGTLTLRGTVTDSRGRTKVKTVTATFLAYVPPTLNTVTVQRALSGGTVDDNGTYLRVNINAAVQSLMNTTQRNAINYRVSTRLRGGTTWTQKAQAAPGGITFNSSVTVGTYSITQAYEVLVEVYDDFLTTGFIFSVPVAKIFMHWDAGLGVGIGKYREFGLLDVAGDIYAKDGVVDPVGSIVLYGGDTAPQGWAIADGAAVSRLTYADLFAKYGTKYGAGDGSTTFNLPNLKGRVPVGRDAGQTEFDTLGETGGNKTHAHNEGNLAAAIGASNGDINALTYAQTGVNPRGPASVGPYTMFGNGGPISSTRSFNHYTQVYGTTEIAGSLPPYQTLNFIVKLA